MRRHQSSGATNHLAPHLAYRHRARRKQCCRNLISTTANYFSFPTQKRNFGYPLDNTEILSSGFGAVSNHHLLEELRVGDETLADLLQQYAAKETSPALACYSTNKSQELHNNNLYLQQKTQKTHSSDYFLSLIDT